MVLSRYAEAGHIPKDIEKDHLFSGLGTKRWLDFFKKQKKDWDFIGVEFNPYNPKNYDPDVLKTIFSEKFVDGILRGDKVEDLKVETENDKLARDSFSCYQDFYKNREKFWMKNIKSILKKNGNLFIVGFHMDKNEPIGKMIKDKFKDKALFLGMAAYDIKTQLLVVDDKNSSVEKFNKALETGRYQTRVDDISRWVPPTRLEKTLMKKSKKIELLKVESKNKDEKIRGIGCFVAMTMSEYQNHKNIEGVFDYLRYFDYIIYIKKSVYRENMFE